MQRLLISSSHDGFLKFWDLAQQTCVLSHSTELMTKISSMCLIPHLNTIAVGFGTEEKHLKLFEVVVSDTTFGLEIKTSSLKK